MPEKFLCRKIVIAGTVLIWTIKWAVRPYFIFFQPVKYLLGIAPNLLGSFLLPLGCIWLFNRRINLRNMYVLKLFCTSAFALLVINELLQLIPVFGRTFDPGDIAASATGLCFSYIFCTKYLFRRFAVYP